MRTRLVLLLFVASPYARWSPADSPVTVPSKQQTR